MSTSTVKLSEEKKRKPSELRWLSGFAVLGSILALPGLLPVTANLNLDGDPSQGASRFFALNTGFLLGFTVSTPLLKKFGVRMAAIAGSVGAVASLIAITLLTSSLSFFWELLWMAAAGVAASAIALACLSALTPWSSRLGARALPRVAEFISLGCMFSAIVAGGCYASGWGHLTPVPLAAGAFWCGLFCAMGRRPLSVVERRPTKPDAKIRKLRSIASFLLLCLLFSQLSSEWAVAAWLPLFLIHRLGSGPSAALFILAFYFLALLLGRALVQKVSAKLRSQTLAICGAILAWAGCLTLTLSTSTQGILLGLTALGLGLAPPYLVTKNVLDERHYFAPAFYRVILAVSVTGAMCSAWLLGYVHQFLGLGALFLFPGAGTVLVVVLELLLIFESHLMGERPHVSPELPATGRRTY